MKRSGAILLIAALALGGCYQSIGGGYLNRFVGEPTGHGGEGHWVFTGADVAGAHGGVVPFGKFAASGGEFGFRAADTFGMMFSDSVGEQLLAFARPGLSLLVAGFDDDGRKEPPLWFGIGLDADVGVMVRTGDDFFVELGANLGADLGYAGLGTSLRAGVFVSLGWVTHLDFDIH